MRASRARGADLDAFSLAAKAAPNSSASERPPIDPIETAQSVPFH